jgi:hypothetical protein
MADVAIRRGTLADLDVIVQNNQAMAKVSTSLQCMAPCNVQANARMHVHVATHASPYGELACAVQETEGIELPYDTIRAGVQVMACMWALGAAASARGMYAASWCPCSHGCMHV